MSEGTFATDNRTRHKVVFERTYRAPVILRYAEEWERIVTRLGRWVDFGDAYKTMERSYMESAMWAFGWLHELGLV
jgi:isoleucyl-tRNA synthetase